MSDFRNDMKAATPTVQWSVEPETNLFGGYVPFLTCRHCGGKGDLTPEYAGYYRADAFDQRGRAYICRKCHGSR